MQLMLAGEPAAGQGRVVVPAAAVDCGGDGDPDIEHWKKHGVKTYWLGYDAYGEPGSADITSAAEKAASSAHATERFARTDTSVTGQALQDRPANPTRCWSSPGSGAAMPQ